MLHGEAIKFLISLRPERLHRKAFAGVQHPHLYESTVDVARHLAAERIDLAHKVAFCRAADGGVAGHQGYIIEIKGDEQRPGAHARRGQRRLAAGMSGTYYHHIMHNLPVLINFTTT